jgi:hypothetical protein
MPGIWVSTFRLLDTPLGGLARRHVCAAALHSAACCLLTIQNHMNLTIDYFVDNINTSHGIAYLNRGYRHT